MLANRIKSWISQLVGGGAAAPPAAAPPAASFPDYEAMLERFYSRLTLRDAHIVDIGAHVGRHALPLARMAGMGGACHAFEPIPAIRRQLCDRVAAEGVNNVIVYPYALSTAPGLAEFNFVPNLPEESGLKERKYYNAPPAPFEKIPVKVARLDDVLPEGAPVRFVKMDVEGGERDVLLGAPRLLDRCRPIVAFECGAASFLGYHDAPEEIYRMFATRGYRVYSITGEWIQDEAQFRAASYRQAYWDYVAFAEGDHALAALLKPA